MTGLNLCLFMMRHHWQVLPMDLTDDDFLHKVLISVALTNVSKDIDKILLRQSTGGENSLETGAIQLRMDRIENQFVKMQRDL